MKWQRVCGTQEEKPLEYDFAGSPGKVYVRENIKREEDHWEYNEALMTMQEFSVYSQAKALEKQSAMDETLAEILLNQMEV